MIEVTLDFIANLVWRPVDWSAPLVSGGQGVWLSPLRHRR